MPDEHRSHLGAAAETPEAGRLKQLAAEMILSASSLTDELTDEEAQPLIDWGLRQAEAAADDLSRASQEGGTPAFQYYGDVLADRLDAVRRIMKRTNRLAVRRQAMPAEEVREELRRLLALAESVPRPPSLNMQAVPMADLSVARSDLENGPFVRALVGLLDDSPWVGEQQDGPVPLGKEA